MNEITNTQDLIDSRDIIARIEELETDQEMLADEITETIENLEASEGAVAEMAAGRELEKARNALLDFNEENEAELDALQTLANEADGSPDWQHGETLIRYDYFADYIKDLIEDCYEMPKEMDSGAWPYRHMEMDYDGAANEAEQDYLTVDFDGVDYLIRNC